LSSGTSSIREASYKVYFEEVAFSKGMVTGICPKCNKIGKQRIHTSNGYAHLQYLEYVHSEKGKLRTCHIGRVKSTEEAMSEFNEPTEKQYKDTIENMVRDIRALVRKYPSESRILQHALASRLEDIFRRYGC